MIMKVSEFIEFLKTQPQDADVVCIWHNSGHDVYSQGGDAHEVIFKPDAPTRESNYQAHWDLYEFNDGRKELTIGSMNN